MPRDKEAETTYNVTKCISKHATWMAKSEAKNKKIATVSQGSIGVFYITQHMDHKNTILLAINVYTKIMVSQHLLLKICKAPRKIKCGKAAGSAGNIAKMLKAAGEEILLLSSVVWSQ